MQITLKSIITNYNKNPLSFQQLIKDKDEFVLFSNYMHNFINYYIQSIIVDDKFSIEVRYNSDNTSFSYANSYYVHPNRYIVELAPLKPARTRKSATIKYKDIEFDNPYDLLGFLIGLVEHEYGHYLYTNLQNFQKLHDDNLPPLLRYIWNILEDGRVEYHMKTNSPLDYKFIEHMNDIIYNKTPYVIAKGDVSDALYCLSYYVIYHKFPLVIIPNPAKFNSLLNDLKQILTPIDKILSMPSMDDLLPYAQQIYALFKRYFNNMNEQNISMDIMSNEEKYKHRGIKALLTAMLGDNRVENSRYFVFPTKPIEDIPDDNERINSRMQVDNNDKGNQIGEKININNSSDDGKSLFSINGYTEYNNITDLYKEAKKYLIYASSNSVVDGIKVYSFNEIISTLNINPMRLLEGYEPQDNIIENAKVIENRLNRLLKFLDERFKYNYYSSRGHLLSKKFHRLKQSEITGIPPRIFRQKRSKTKVDITIAFLLDMSSSMATSTPLLREVSQTILYAIKDFHNIHIAIYGFNDNRTMTNYMDRFILNLYEFKNMFQPTSLINLALLDKIGSYKLITPDNATPLVEAMEYMYYLLTNYSPSKNNALIILTDGLVENVNQALKVKREWDIPTYAIYYNENPDKATYSNLISIFGEDYVAYGTNYQKVIDIFTNSLENFINEVYIGQNA